MNEIATQQCPHCKETIRADASICRYCGMKILRWSDLWKGVLIGLIATPILFFICALLNRIPAP